MLYEDIQHAIYIHEWYETRLPARWISFMGRAVYSHTTPKAIQYYINIRSIMYKSIFIFIAEMFHTSYTS